MFYTQKRNMHVGLRTCYIRTFIKLDINNFDTNKTVKHIELIF